MRIAYVVYPDFTGLDLVGPYEIHAGHCAAARPHRRPG
jgi:hypothetical protein